MIFNSILQRAPTPPLRINPDLPQELERIINNALEKDRDLRYQVASEMRADLKRLKRETDSSRSAVIAAEEDEMVAAAPASRPAEAKTSSSKIKAVSSAAPPVVAEAPPARRSETGGRWSWLSRRWWRGDCGGGRRMGRG